MKINTNITGLESFNEDIFKDTMYQAIQNMAQETMDFWKSIAGRRLKSSRAKYQQAIQLEGVTGDSFDVTLSGGFAYALEVGTGGPYPMQMEKGKIAPLNVNRLIVFTKPQVWRTGTGEPWMHPGFPGFNMRNDVVDELLDNILPKYVDEVMSKL